MSDQKSWEYQFIASWDDVESAVHANAKAKGFWDKERNDGEALALIHSEVSEALEALRRGNPPDDKASGTRSATTGKHWHSFIRRYPKRWRHCAAAIRRTTRSRFTPEPRRKLLT